MKDKLKILEEKKAQALVGGGQEANAWQAISKEKGLEQLASINRHSSVFYGYDSIWQIVVRLPLLWVFVPVFYILKVSRLGHWAYKELAIKRQIIPLHCKEEDCHPN